MNLKLLRFRLSSRMSTGCSWHLIFSNDSFSLEKITKKNSVRHERSSDKPPSNTEDNLQATSVATLNSCGRKDLSIEFCVMLITLVTTVGIHGMWNFWKCLRTVTIRIREPENVRLHSVSAFSFPYSVRVLRIRKIDGNRWEKNWFGLVAYQPVCRNLSILNVILWLPL